MKTRAALIALALMLAIGSTPALAASRFEKACRAAAEALLPAGAEVTVTDQFSTIYLEAGGAKVECDFADLSAPIPELSRLVLPDGSEADAFALSRANSDIMNYLSTHL